MPGTNEQTVPPRKTVVFGEDGGEIEASEENELQDVTEEAEAGAEGEEAEGEGEGEGAAGEGEGGEGKIKIGDMSFNSVEEAHAWASKQVGQEQDHTQEVNAYRQVIQEALRNPNGGENVTPAKPQFDEEKLWANPQEFLQEFGNNIRQQTLDEINKANALKANGEAVWNEFTGRHPQLADFREEVEQFAAANTKELAALTKAKGRTATYDYIAVSLKAKFQRYADAQKPRRELPNGKGGTSPSGKGTGVTPTKPAKKPLSFSEQIRSIKKKR